MKSTPIARIGLILFCLLATGARAAELEWLHDASEALQLANQRHQMILVDLSADWCVWCAHLEHEVFPSPEFQEVAKNYIPLQLDIEDDLAGTVLYQKYGVTGLPTTLILDSKGAVAARIAGFSPPEEFTQHLRSELKAYDDFLARYRRESTSRQVRVISQLAVAAHNRFDGRRAAPLYEALLAHNDIPPADRRRLEYYLADAERLAGRFDDATQQLAQVRSESEVAGDEKLLGWIADVEYLTVRDRWDCGAESALQAFVDSHKHQPHYAEAKRLLHSRHRKWKHLCADQGGAS